MVTTKVIVSPNINEHAEEGICEIAKSLYSETGENYITKIISFLPFSK